MQYCTDAICREGLPVVLRSAMSGPTRRRLDRSCLSRSDHSSVALAVITIGIRSDCCSCRGLFACSMKPSLLYYSPERSLEPLECVLNRTNQFSLYHSISIARAVAVPTNIDPVNKLFSSPVSTGQRVS